MEILAPQLPAGVHQPDRRDHRLPRADRRSSSLDITRLLLDRLDRRLRAQRIEVEFTDEAVRLLARGGLRPRVRGAAAAADDPAARRERALADGARRRASSRRQGRGARDDDLRFEVEKGGAPELFARGGGETAEAEPAATPA